MRLEVSRTVLGGEQKNPINEKKKMKAPSSSKLKEIFSNVCSMSVDKIQTIQIKIKVL